MFGDEFMSSDQVPIQSKSAVHKGTNENHPISPLSDSRSLVPRSSMLRNKVDSDIRVENLFGTRKMSENHVLFETLKWH
jgi:predicted FMN-binding regulatory protein PaiB